MSDFLTIGGIPVPVIPSTRIVEQRIGDVGRAFSLKMRSSIRGTPRMIPVQTSELSTSDSLALRAAIGGPGPVAVDGDILGGDGPVDFVIVGDVDVRPITADWWVLAFELHEDAP